MPESDFDEVAWRERLEAFRREKATHLLEGANSPIADVTGTFELSWFPLDPAYRVVARYQPVETVETVALASTTGPDRSFERRATFGFTLRGGHHVLTGYRAEGQSTLFVPFTDETAGEETPAVGRYLDVDPGEAGMGDDVVLEFNLAQVPFAAYSERYVSVVPPARNHVSAAIRAGEREPAAVEDGATSSEKNGG